jgi:hypothetical protein
MGRGCARLAQIVMEDTMQKDRMLAHVQMERCRSEMGRAEGVDCSPLPSLMGRRTCRSLFGSTSASRTGFFSFEMGVSVRSEKDVIRNMFSHSGMGGIGLPFGVGVEFRKFWNMSGDLGMGFGFRKSHSRRGEQWVLPKRSVSPRGRALPPRQN